MNRTIKFRGLRTDGKGWAYGDLLHPHDGNPSTFIVMKNWQVVEVRPDTVGQFVMEMNGTEVYEGDRITTDDGTTYTVKFIQECFMACHEKLLNKFSFEWQIDGAKVTGNIHQTDQHDTRRPY